MSMHTINISNAINAFNKIFPSIIPSDPNEVFVLKTGTMVWLYSYPRPAAVGVVYVEESIEYIRSELIFTKNYILYKFHKPYPRLFDRDITSIEWVK